MIWVWKIKQRRGNECLSYSVWIESDRIPWFVLCTESLLLEKPNKISWQMFHVEVWQITVICSYNVKQLFINEIKLLNYLAIFCQFPRRLGIESYDYNVLYLWTFFYTLNAVISHLLKVHRILKLKSSWLNSKKSTRFNFI